MREFRSHLQQYVLTSAPVAITRHGETVGYYIPTKNHTEKSDLKALKEAAAKLDRLLEEHNITEDALLDDYKKLKSGNKK